MPKPLATGFSLLGGHPNDIALVSDDASVSYGELTHLVAERSGQLGSTRRLVMITAENALEPIVTYLAALEGGHPVLFVAGGSDEAALRHRAALVDHCDPDVIAHGAASEWQLEERRESSRHDFHPELAMLASTSGSTGSPKLVRLSADNLSSNAESIAHYLGITEQDRAITTLPLQYCYGLSVINSHLISGASIVLSDRSVADEQFWEQATENRITSFAGVPYTFDLLDAAGFSDRSLPNLRYITQAGGKLAPEVVRRFAKLGEDRGFDLFVMYGQTEATARMAYLPPDRLQLASETIGVPIPGGSFIIDSGDGTDAIDGRPGELVYSGPNVMLGYAESPRDFALGRTVESLRTGDVARRRDDGLIEIVGRLNRFVKVFGLRLDLDRVEHLLDAEGITALAASSDDRLLLFTTSERTARIAAQRAAELLGIPPHAIRYSAVAEFPRTSSGKPDRAALVRFAELQDAAPEASASTAALSPEESVRQLLSTVLAEPIVTPDDSFASLGGDSLSYIEVSVRLEALLGPLPRDWPSRTVSELVAASADREAAGGSGEEAASQPGRGGATSRLSSVETPAVLRAIAIVIIVATHADLIMLKGGAHLLLAVAGYNVARFQLASAAGIARSGRLWKSALQIAIPAVLWIGAVGLVAGHYLPTTALLVNNFVPSDGRWNVQWQFWFLEAAVWILVVVGALLAIRPIDRLERRSPFVFALAIFAAALAVRFIVVGLHAGGVERYAAPFVVWLFALGWVVARASTLRDRLIASVLTVVSVLGFFGDPLREGVIVVGVLALLWVPAIRLPRMMVPAVSTLAGASLFIYLTHWQVYPPFESSAPWLGTVLSLAVGIGVWQAYRFSSLRLGSLAARLASRASSGGGSALTRPWKVIAASRTRGSRLSRLRVENDAPVNGDSNDRTRRELTR